MPDGIDRRDLLKLAAITAALPACSKIEQQPPQPAVAVDVGVVRVASVPTAV